MKPQSTETGGERPEDEEIAGRARLGDTEAFGELIRRHRAQAVGWARSLAQDKSLAEDIAQEAFVKAFLHVGSLAEPDRFPGWLRRIVRNEANMKLRRGGPYRRETPFSSFAAGRGIEPPAHGDRVLKIWLDRPNHEEEPSHAESDPLRHLLRKEWLDLFRTLLSCLNERERGMFEAYFFMQFSADEVAAMFGTTPGSVHTYLHRSKRKIKDKAYTELTDFGSAVTIAPVLRKNALSVPTGIPDVRDTFMDRIGKLLRARGETATAVDLMGRSGHAFRLKMSRITTYADGFFVFDWKREIRQIAGEYGYDAEFSTSQLEGSPIPLHPVSMLFEVSPANEQAVMEFIRHFVDRGCPVLFFDTYVNRPYVHEWNLIYGYNDMERTVELTDVSPPYRKTLRFTELAESPLRFLCGLQKTNRAAARKDDILAQLQSVIRHVREGISLPSGSSYISGIRALDTWIRHLEAGPRLANAYGHRYLAYVHANAGTFAGPYLRSLGAERYVEGLISDAAALYDEAAGFLQQLSLLTPLHGESRWTGDILKGAIALLETVRDTEARAVHLLEEAVQIVEVRYNDEE